MQQQNERLRTHRNLRPFQLRVYGHRAGLLRVFVGNDAAVFECGRRHEKRWRLRTTACSAAATPASLTAPATLAAAATLTAALPSALPSALRNRRDRTR